MIVALYDSELYIMNESMYAVCGYLFQGRMSRVNLVRSLVDVGQWRSLLRCKHGSNWAAELVGANEAKATW